MRRGYTLGLVFSIIRYAFRLVSLSPHTRSKSASSHLVASAMIFKRMSRTEAHRLTRSLAHYLTMTNIATAYTDSGVRSHGSTTSHTRGIPSNTVTIVRASSALVQAMHLWRRFSFQRSTRQRSHSWHKICRIALARATAWPWHAGRAKPRQPSFRLPNSTKVISGELILITFLEHATPGVVSARKRLLRSHVTLTAVLMCNHWGLAQGVYTEERDGGGYQLPPQEIIDIVDAAADPLLSFTPDRHQVTSLLTLQWLPPTCMPIIHVLVRSPRQRATESSQLRLCCATSCEVSSRDQSIC